MGQLNNLDWEHVDISALIDGIKGNGVVSGLGVTESTTPAMTVLVGSGSCNVAGTEYEESSAQNLNISNGDSTHPRKDIVVYDVSASNPAIVEGTAAAAPVPPNVPSGDIYLAMIHVDAAESISITNNDIDEGRVYVNPYHVPSGMISMWHGLIANIPTGYLICDGTNGTPDLRAKFLRGAPASTEAGSTGGSDAHTLIESEMPSHNHTMWGRPGYGGGGGNYTAFNTGYPIATSSTGGGGSHNNMPAYYEILYIMKS